MKMILRRLIINKIINQEVFIKRHDSTRCLGKMQKRSTYPRMYTATMVNQDGSTIKIRHKEPIHIIDIPIDLMKLNDKERRSLWLERRGRKEEVIEELDDHMMHDDYKKFLKS